MAAGKLRNLYEDNEHYNKSFMLYGRQVDRSGKMERWSKSVFHEEILPHLDVQLSEGEELRTLGIGSGSGHLESHVLKQLLQKYPRISNHVVEPSVELANQYKTHICESSAELQGIDYHWHQQLLQNFQEDRERRADKTKFHFISAIDSLYYFDHLGRWLDYLYDLLDEGGILMVVLLADESFLVKMWDEFPGLGNKSKYGFAEFTSTDVQKHFDKREIRYRHFIGEVSGVDMTQAFDAQPPMDADLLLDFVSHTINFRQNADSELRVKFMKFLRQSLQPCGDKLLFNTVSGITIVQK